MCEVASSSSASYDLLNQKNHELEIENNRLKQQILYFENNRKSLFMLNARSEADDRARRREENVERSYDESSICSQNKFF